MLRQGLLRRAGMAAASCRPLPVHAGGCSNLHTFHTPDESMPPVSQSGIVPPFFKLLAANRGEISTRITRAATELGISTAGIYSHEGRKTLVSFVCCVLLAR